MCLLRQPDVEVRLADRRVSRSAPHLSGRHHPSGPHAPREDIARERVQRISPCSVECTARQVIRHAERDDYIGGLRNTGRISTLVLSVTATWLMLTQDVHAAPDLSQFTVERFALRVLVNPDASAGLSYDFTLLMHHDALPLTELFFPLPNAGFEVKRVRATLDNQPVADLRQERYGEPGFWLRLGKHALKRGDRGTLHIELTLTDMVAADPRRPGHGVLEVELPPLAGMSRDGIGDVAITVHALPGIKPDELHASGGKQKKTGSFDGRATIAWRWPQGKLAKIGAIRASFPVRGLNRLAARSSLGGPVRWLERTWWARLLIGALFVGAFWFFYFRFTDGRGLVVFLVLTGVLVGLMAMSAAAQLVLVPTGLLLIATGELYRWRTRATAEEEAEIDDEIEVEVVPGAEYIEQREPANQPWRQDESGVAEA